MTVKNARGVRPRTQPGKYEPDSTRLARSAWRPLCASPPNRSPPPLLGGGLALRGSSTDRSLPSSLWRGLADACVAIDRERLCGNRQRAISVFFRSDRRQQGQRHRHRHQHRHRHRQRQRQRQTQQDDNGRRNAMVPTNGAVPEDGGKTTNGASGEVAPDLQAAAAQQQPPTNKKDESSSSGDGNGKTKKKTVQHTATAKEKYGATTAEDDPMTTGTTMPTGTTTSSNGLVHSGSDSDSSTSGAASSSTGMVHNGGCNGSNSSADAASSTGLVRHNSAAAMGTMTMPAGTTGTTMPTGTTTVELNAPTAISRRFLEIVVDNNDAENGAPAFSPINTLGTPTLVARSSSSDSTPNRGAGSSNSDSPSSVPTPSVLRDCGNLAGSSPSPTCSDYLETFGWRSPGSPSSSRYDFWTNHSTPKHTPDPKYNTSKYGTVVDRFLSVAVHVYTKISTETGKEADW